MREVSLRSPSEVEEFYRTGPFERCGLHFHVEQVSFATLTQGFFDKLTQIARRNIMKTIRFKRVEAGIEFLALLNALWPGNLAPTPPCATHCKSESGATLDTTIRRVSENMGDIELYITESRVSCSSVATLRDHPMLCQVAVLDMSSSILPGTSLPPLLSKLSAINYAKKLVLSGIVLPSAAVECLRDWLLTAGCSLQVLVLDNCALSTRNGGDAFLLEVPAFRSLQSLSLGHNQLHHFPSSHYLELAHCSSLRQLCLEHIPIAAEDAFMLGFVTRMSSLQSLNLSGCSMGDKELAAFVAGFGYYDCMPGAPAARCRPPMASSAPLFAPPAGRTFDNEKKIVQSFCEWSFLEEKRLHKGQKKSWPPLLLDLNLSDNRVRSAGLVSPLLENSCVGLSCLTLAGNRLAHEPFLELCNALAGAQTLQYLCLRNCELDRHSLAQLFVACRRGWSRAPQTCLFPLAASLSSTDLCCSLPHPLSRAAHVLTLPFSSDPPATQQQWVWFWGAHSSSSSLPAGDPPPPPPVRCVPPLRHLDISCNSLGFKGAQLLRTVLLTRKSHPLEELILRRNHLGLTGAAALLEVLATDQGLRLLALSRTDLGGGDGHSLPPELEAATVAPGKLLCTLPLNSTNKFTFLLSIERRWAGIYLPPEIVRIVFSYLACPIYRTVSVA